MHPLIVAPVIVGIMLSSYSILGRLGMPKGIHLLHISAVMGICGGLWFIPLAMQEIHAHGSPPIWLAFLGFANATVRYLSMILWNRALKMGPLSLLACASNLGFIVTVPYVRLVHDQSSSFTQWLAAGLAVVAVILAAKSNAVNDDTGSHFNNRVTLLYFAILLGAWFLGGAGNIIIKEIDLRHTVDGQSYIGTFGNFFFIFEYGGLGVLAALDCLISRRRPGSFPRMVGMGLLAFGAALIVVHFLRIGITLHPAIFFSTCNVTTILFSVLVGTIVFKEKRSFWWYLTIITSVAVVLVANAGIGS